MEAKSKSLLERDPANPNVTASNPASGAQGSTKRNVIRPARPPSRPTTPSGRVTPGGRTNPSAPVRPAAVRAVKSPDESSSAEASMKSIGDKGAKQSSLSSAPVRPTKIKRNGQGHAGGADEHARQRDVGRMNNLPLEPAGAAAMNVKSSHVNPKTSTRMETKEKATPKTSPKVENCSPSEEMKGFGSPVSMRPVLPNRDRIPSPSTSLDANLSSRISNSPKMTAERGSEALPKPPSDNCSVAEVLGRAESPLLASPLELTSPVAVKKENTAGHEQESRSVPSTQTMYLDNSAQRWARIEAAAQRRAPLPRSTDPQYCRRLLEKGIASVQNGSMNVVGYRHLQGLVIAGQEVFQEGRLYDDLLLVLLHELATMPEEKKGKTQAEGHPYDVKTQVLLSVLLMFRIGRPYFQPYTEQAMLAIVTARGNFEDHAHIVCGLAKAGHDLAEESCDPENAMNMLLDQVDGVMMEETKDSRMRLMVIEMVEHLLSRGAALNSQLMKRVCHFGASSLSNGQARIREAAISLCLRLYARLGVEEKEFFSILGYLPPSQKNLLTYFIAQTGY